VNLVSISNEISALSTAKQILQSASVLGGPRHDTERKAIHAGISSDIINKAFKHLIAEGRIEIKMKAREGMQFAAFLPGRFTDTDTRRAIARAAAERKVETASILLDQKPEPPPPLGQSGKETAPPLPLRKGKGRVEVVTGGLGKAAAAAPIAVTIPEAKAVPKPTPDELEAYRKSVTEAIRAIKRSRAIKKG
jgi:hypothetical protein